jgi:hypothetical protein
MQENQKLTIDQTTAHTPRPCMRRPGRMAIFVLCLGIAPSMLASEGVPFRPFAQYADLPQAGQFFAGIVYEQSEAYRIWSGGQEHVITVKSGGESYGIDVNQGFLAFQYGITEKLAVDANVGATTVGWRAFVTNNATESTTGLMDTSVGIRYQLFNEAQTNSAWTPTLTFRLGAVIPGTYTKDFAFTPGNSSYALQPEFLARKHFGWPGFGMYADVLYRWNFNTGDQYITTIGLLQQIKQWELAAGYRHVQTISGDNIVLNPDHTIVYPRDVREINDSIEAGFSYVTKKHVRWGFQSRTVFDGNNTDRKFWVGASLDIPFGGKKED